jgi:hypothetical protein
MDSTTIAKGSVTRQYATWTACPVSVEAWEEQLAARGLALNLAKVSPGNWIAVVNAPGDPVANKGAWGDSYDQAIRAALDAFEQAQRERIVDGLVNPLRGRVGRIDARGRIREHRVSPSDPRRTLCGWWLGETQPPSGNRTCGRCANIAKAASGGKP